MISGVSLFATSLMLGLLVKHDTYIVSPHSQSPLLREIVMQ